MRRSGISWPGLIVAALLGGPGDRAAGADEVERGRVVAATVDVVDGPDSGAFVIGRLARGSSVAIRGRQGDWLEIDPPAGAFCWVEDRVLQDERDGTARVLEDGTIARSGIVGARLPGPPRIALRRGLRVRLLDRPPLTLGDGPTRRAWRAVEPPAEVSYYVRADGVRGPGSAMAARASLSRAAGSPGPGSEPESFRLPSVDAGLASPGPSGESANLSADLAARLRPIESEHRATLRLPLPSWRLETVRRRYEDLLASTSDPTARAILRARVQHVGRQQEAAEAARRFRDLVMQSRVHDGARIVPDPDPDATAAAPPELAHDVVGLLQRSNRLVEGSRAYVLIGPEGYAEAYLKFPPGLHAERYVSRQVGVRGEVGYNPDLRARVVTVREIDALSAAP